MREEQKDVRSPAQNSAGARQACANRPVYRKQCGADHPKVRQLEVLCARAGY